MKKRPPEPLSSVEAKELIRLCETGRLYEVEAWIAAGKSLAVPKEVRKTPLRVAISTGFYSLDELLLRHERGQDEKNDALHHALFLNRPAMIELSVTYGADIASIPFLDVLMTGYRALVDAFLKKGADLTTDYPFARAFHQLRAKTTLGSYLDCRRSRPDVADHLQQQADMALRQFCQEGNLKWVSLLIWAGANPRSSGPALDDADHIDDPEWHTTAMAEACASGSVDVFKRLKPSPTDDLARMLERAAFSAHRDVLAYLLDLGANPNDRPDGGSSALEACIRHLGWEDFDRVQYGFRANYQTPGYKVSKGREAIKLLLEHGAMWKPEPSTLNDTRRILYRIEPNVTVELIGLLLKNPDGESGVRELLRVPRMRQHIASSERQLARLGFTLDERRRSDAPTTRPPSSYVLARYDRERLYEEVWSAPTQKVARKYGISEVALAKVCKQLHVPKPPRGYWAKKDAGQPVQGKLLRDAEGQIGALSEVLGGTCVVGNMCPAKFACIGCAGNAPDPSRRDQVDTKRRWAEQQIRWTTKEGLYAEQRQMAQLVRDCDVVLYEMDLIAAARKDDQQAIVVRSGDGKSSRK